MNKLRNFFCAEAAGNTDIVDNWEKWYGMMKERRMVVKKLAEKYNAIFVPFGEMFDEVCKTSPANRWTADGIHVSSAGNELMARKWIECVRNSGINI